MDDYKLDVKDLFTDFDFEGRQYLIFKNGDIFTRLLTEPGYQKMYFEKKYRNYENILIGRDGLIHSSES